MAPIGAHWRHLDVLPTLIKTTFSAELLLNPFNVIRFNTPFVSSKLIFWQQFGSQILLQECENFTTINHEVKDNQDPVTLSLRRHEPRV